MGGIGASLGGEPHARRATISGGETTYPKPEVFDCLSEFQLLGKTTWSDLLDGRGTIIIGYKGLASAGGGVIEYGFVILNEASMVIEGTIVPEPATVLFLTLGVVGLRVGKFGIIYKSDREAEHHWS
jgi:alanine dehydrogenase